MTGEQKCLSLHRHTGSLPDLHQDRKARLQSGAVVLAAGRAEGGMDKFVLVLHPVGGAEEDGALVFLLADMHAVEADFINENIQPFDMPRSVLTTSSTGKA